jgi:tRNA threonylcarbamoyladenosine modification (KEOPS) complex  Pcc1 subunit
LTNDIENGTATLELDLGSVEMVQMMMSALEPETESVASDRASVQLTAKETVLVIKITAGDLTALRAAMNSYLAWISGSTKAVESVTGQNRSL